MTVRSLTAWLLSLSAALGCSGCGGKQDGVSLEADRVLVISSRPRGEVWIDGVARGRAPVEVRVTAGAHEVEIRLGGFEAHESKVTVSADRTELSFPLRISDAEDREALQLLADDLLDTPLWVQTFEEPQTERGGDVKAVRVLFPRGNVRARDLRSFRVEWAPGSASAGAIEFRRGDDLIHREVVSEGALRQLDGTLPSLLREKLSGGGKVTWGFYPTEGEPTTTAFDIVADSADAKLEGALAAVENGAKGQNPTAIGYLRSQVLMNHGLYYAAHQEASALLASGGKTSMRAWAVVLDALEKMGVGKGSVAWGQANNAVSKLEGSLKRQIHFIAGDALKRLGEHLENGHAGRALATLGRHGQGEGSLDPEQILDISTMAASGARRMVRQAPGSARELVGAIIKLASTAREAHADVAPAHWAVGWASVAEGRIAEARGEKPGPERWLRAVENVGPALEMNSAEGAGYLQAVMWLHEAAGLEGVDPRPLVRRSKELAEQAAIRFPDSVHPAIASARTEMLQLQVAPRMKRKKKRETVMACFDVLQPHMATDRVDPDVATLHTDTVTFSKEGDLRLKEATYRGAKHIGTRNILTFEVPLSKRWQVTEAPPEPYIAVVRQLDAHGGLLRLVTVKIYQWGVPYLYLSGRRVSGENPGGLAKQNMEEVLGRFKRVTRKRRVGIMKISRRFTRAHYYDVKGTLRDGSFLRLRSWLFKSKEHKVTYEVAIQEFQDDLPHPDPELRFLLDSFVDLSE